jgi:hypothetical protein
MASTAITVRSEANPPRGRVTTFAQYQRAVQIAMRERRGLRKGQTFVDVLVELEPQLAQRLTGTADDPFYDDGKLPGFLVRVAEALR